MSFDSNSYQVIPAKTSIIPMNSNYYNSTVNSTLTFNYPNQRQSCSPLITYQPIYPFNSSPSSSQSDSSNQIAAGLKESNENRVPVSLNESIIDLNVSTFLGNNNEAQQFLSKGGQVIVRMRGLPYDCTAQQVVSCRWLNFNLIFNILWL